MDMRVTIRKAYGDAEVYQWFGFTRVKLLEHWRRLLRGYPSEGWSVEEYPSFDDGAEVTAVIAERKQAKIQAQVGTEHALAALTERIEALERMIGI